MQIFPREESMNHTLWDAEAQPTSLSLQGTLSHLWLLPESCQMVCVGSRASNITQSSCVSARERPLNVHFHFPMVDWLFQLESPSG